MSLRLLSLALLLTAACGRPAKDQALLDVKSFIQQNIDSLLAASISLQADAPAPTANGWNPTNNGAAVQTMRSDWKKARTAYEHVEGAIAVLFPELDISTDERYDGFVSIGPDNDLFDDQGATGIHSVERILWADSIPPKVVEFEQGLPNYVPAAFPANETQAREFKEKLLVRLVNDVKQMKSEFGPLALDTAAAYRGVIGSMREQLEKANKAATGEEESRYAQYTLADMRVNVEAGTTTYTAFRPWLLEQKGGKDLDVQIQAGFARVQAAYAKLSGDALPEVPSTWSSENPSAQDLATPFGQLYQVLSQEADPQRSGSLVQAMNASADLLQIPVLK